jgi:hypothetical protein
MMMMMMMMMMMDKDDGVPGFPQRERESSDERP